MFSAGHNPQFPLLLSALLKYENNISVVNYSLDKDPSYVKPVKNKELLVFHVGFRRYQGCPTLSQASNRTDKHKMERFLHAERPTVASLLAPISYVILKTSTFFAQLLTTEY
jgi:pre-rRNA-processing protein TSR1